MKSTRGVIIALCGIAALALAIRAWQPDTAGDTSSARRARGAASDAPGQDQHGSSEGAFGALHTGPANGAAGSVRAAPGGGTHPADQAAGNETQQRSGGAPARRLPPAIAGAQKGAVQRSGNRPYDTDSEPVGDLDRHVDRAEPSGQELKDHIPKREPGPEGNPDGEPVAAPSDDRADEPAPEVAYDGGPDHVFDTTTRAEITDAGKIAGEAGTISFWIDPQWQGNAQEDANFVQIGDGLQIVKKGNLLRFEFIDGSGAQHGGSADMSDWPDGEWRHVAAAWNGGTMSLFVDGGQVFLNSGGPPPDMTDAKLFVGSALPNGATAAPGQLAYLTVMNRDVSVDEVRAMFQAGRNPGQQ